MEAQDFQFEELNISIAVGLAFQQLDFGVGSFQGAGRDAVVIIRQDTVLMGLQGVGELARRGPGATGGRPGKGSPSRRSGPGGPSP